MKKTGFFLSTNNYSELSAISKRLRYLALFVASISIAGVWLWWCLTDLESVLGDAYRVLAPSIHTQQSMRYAGLFIEAIPLSVQLWISKLLYQFASQIERNNVFDTAELYRKLGGAAIALGIIEILSETMARTIMTLIANPHWLTVGISMSTSDLYLMLVGAILLATSSFIAMAKSAKRENDAFI
jgi:hypothetical protein